jgi:acetolactate synthase-1/2/3 large subunit
MAHRMTGARFIAEEMGCLGIRVERPDEIAPALREAGAADRPVAVHVFTDVSCNAPEPWIP